MVLKGNEQFAAKAVSDYLRDVSPPGNWEAGPNPPDLVFHVGAGEVWAGEVTGLYQHFSYRGQAPQSREAMDNPIIKMCDRVRARTAGTLTRSYVLRAFPPTSVPLKRLEREVMDHIASGIEGYWSLDPKGMFTLETTPGEPYRFSSVHGLRPEVMTADGRAVGADIESNVEFAIDKALADKCPRMASITGYSRKLLLLVGEYRLASADTVSRVLARKGLKPFDAVLYVEWGISVSVVADESGLFPTG
ncbi:MAG: hypothetical protein NTV05_03770 [Acidobacteria bacterium]|nr:hypothetical protein [Acidobacteriota bacterium]